MALILQSIMELHSFFRTRKSLTKSSFAKSSLAEIFFTESFLVESSLVDFLLAESSFTESIIETSQPKSNWAVNHSTAARIQALTLAKGLQTLASMEKNIAVKIAAAQFNIREKTVLKYMRMARLQGYNPTVSSVMKKEYVTDASHSDCPLKVTPEVIVSLLSLRKTPS